MGSISEKAAPINLLQYLKSEIQVDADCLEIEVSRTLGPFADLTSNQSDCYTELIKPPHAALLKKAAALGHQYQPKYPMVTAEELGMEIAMITLSMTFIPVITGDIHVMANPIYSYDTEKMYQNGLRLKSLCTDLDPNFDLSRLVMKVPSTWEGFQACRKLTEIGIKTLATTLYTFEQAVLAGEVGCISIAPFVHNLKVHYDPEYIDTDPVFDVCVEAQHYYKQHSISTRVKACSLLTVDHVMRLVGIDALTLPGDLLKELSETEKPEAEVRARSMFYGHSKSMEPVELISFVDDEAKYRSAMAKSDKGRGQPKTDESIAIFSKYQKIAEAMMRDTDLTAIG